MAGHNKGADIQRKVDYFRELKARGSLATPKGHKPQMPRAAAIPFTRRPGMRGK